MKRPRFQIDFNGSARFDPSVKMEPGSYFRLCKEDFYIDENGSKILLYDGMEVDVFDVDYEIYTESVKIRDDLIASGTAHRYFPRAPGSQFCWVVRLDANGIRHESDLNEEANGTSVETNASPNEDRADKT